jgi:tRNA-binding EMAP/Myf-like protein
VSELNEEIQQLDLVVATVVEATEHPGSRAASYLLTLDLGAKGERQASILRGGYEPEDLVGRQVVCAVRGDEAFVLAARSHAGGSILLHPEREVDPGTIVG